MMRRHLTDTGRLRLRALLAYACVAALACERASPPPEAPPPPPVDPPAQPAEPVGGNVTVYFTRAEQPVAVQRAVEADTADLEVVLRALLRGPTAEERAQGITSWFSDETADALRSATVSADGAAVVDLRDIRSVIPGASSSAGSTMLLHELNATVFRLPHVRTVEYRLDGSCDAFWNWLQYDCRIVQRDDAPSP